MTTKVAPRVGLSFEYIMWVFTRISALALFLLSIIGIASAFYLGARTQMDVGTLLRWTFFPNSYHVVNSEIPDIDLGWANAFWQVIQMLIVFFAATHGMNGLRVVVEDYISHSWWLVFWRGLIFLIWLFMLIVAVFVILTV